MAKANATRKRRFPRIVQVVHARPRLFISAAVGVLAFLLLLLTNLGLAARVLIGWDVGIALYLVLAGWLICHAGVDHIRRQAATEDEGRIAILVFTAAAAFASIGAIFVLLSETSDGRDPPGQLALAVVTVLLSWIFVHTMFAFHYAFEFYAEHRKGGGLDFPGGGDPDYWDFVYFSFVVGTTFQVSDVEITDKLIRRTVSAHGIVSFLFNTALIALVVNIAGNALGK